MQLKINCESIRTEKRLKERLLSSLITVFYSFKISTLYQSLV